MQTIGNMMFQMCNRTGSDRGRPELLHLSGDEWRQTRARIQPSSLFRIRSAKNRLAHKATRRSTPELPFDRLQINFENCLQRSITSIAMSSTHIQVTVRAPLLMNTGKLQQRPSINSRDTVWAFRFRWNRHSCPGFKALKSTSRKFWFHLWKWSVANWVNKSRRPAQRHMRGKTKPDWVLESVLIPRCDGGRWVGWFGWNLIHSASQAEHERWIEGNGFWKNRQ